MSSLETSRKEDVFMAKLAEKAKRYDEMVDFAEKIVKTADVRDLSAEERSLLYAAYKKVTDVRRSSWKIIWSVEQKEESNGNQDRVVIINEYRAKVESELTSICQDILRVLDTYLIPLSTTTESRVLHLKMKGDYHRYLPEFKTGEEGKEASHSAFLAYNSAHDLAFLKLPPSNPTRLELALGFSTFYHDVLKACHMARAHAKQAYAEANSQLATLAEESFQESSLVMQLLKRNLSLWASEAQETAA